MSKVDLFALLAWWSFTVTCAWLWGRHQEAELALDAYQTAIWAVNELERCVGLTTEAIDQAVQLTCCRTIR